MCLQCDHSDYFDHLHLISSGCDQTGGLSVAGADEMDHPDHDHLALMFLYFPNWLDR